jgi:hypothetical protein
LDLETREKVEADLERLITRRDKDRRKEEGERAREMMWKASVARHNEQRRLQARYEWHLHHVGQADRLRRTLEDLIAYHEAAAEKLLDEGRPGEEKDAGAA